MDHQPWTYMRLDCCSLGVHALKWWLLSLSAWGREKACKTRGLMGYNGLRLRWELPDTFSVCVFQSFGGRPQKWGWGHSRGIWWFWAPLRQESCPLCQHSWASYAPSNLPGGKRGSFTPEWVMEGRAITGKKSTSPPCRVCLHWPQSLACSLQVMTVHSSGQRFAITHSNIYLLLGVQTWPQQMALWAITSRQLELIFNTSAKNGFLCGYILLPPGLLTSP